MVTAKVIEFYLPKNVGIRLCVPLGTDREWLSSLVRRQGTQSRLYKAVGVRA